MDNEEEIKQQEYVNIVVATDTICFFPTEHITKSWICKTCVAQIFNKAQHDRWHHLNASTNP